MKNSIKFGDSDNYLHDIFLFNILEINFISYFSNNEFNFFQIPFSFLNKFKKIIF